MLSKSKKNIAIALSALIFTTATASNSISAPKVTVKRQDYRISGNNISEIKQSIAERTPNNTGQGKFSALTKFDIAWNYTFDRTGKHCKIDKITTSVVITQNFPKLENVRQLDLETQAQWDSYFASLKSHEKIHADLGIEAAEEIEKELSKIKPKSTCTKLSIEANNTARSIINYYHNKNVDYDAETIHGILQGADLTPES